MPAALIPILFIVLGAIATVQGVLIWLVAKAVSAPNSSFGDAFKLSLVNSFITAIAYGGYLSLAKYYVPHAIPSDWWLLIIIGFCAQIAATFWLTMDILGIGFLRALVVGLFTNALWKVFGAAAHSLMSR